MIPSYSFDQHDIIRWIIKLHLKEPIECDPTYGKGNFYTPPDIDVPVYISDIYPQEWNIPKRDCRELTGYFKKNSLRSIMFDPPFLQRTGKGSIIKEQFGDYPTMLELWQMYVSSLVEFSMILKPGGWLVVKIQNTVMSGKQWWSVDYITKVAKDAGLSKIDEFILLAKHRMPQHNLKQQRHARKHHCYFLVFRKE